MQPSLVVIAFVLVILAAVFIRFFPIGLWITAMAARVPGVNPVTLVGMRLRKVPQEKIVLPLIAAVKAGLDININQLETHYLAGGSVDRVVNALISAFRAQIPLTFEKAGAVTVDFAVEGMGETGTMHGDHAN